IVLPTKKKNVPLPYKGATVMTPEAGLYENISVLDYTRLYPSIIISANMSPETLTTNVNNVITLSNGISFRKDIEGFVPRKIKTAFAVRDQKDKEFIEVASKYGMESGEYQRAKQMRDCVKGLINSFYGYFGYVNSRLFKLEIASGVTSMGRDAFEWSKHVIEDRQLKVIYGDTDSMMFSTGKTEIKVVVEMSKEIVSALNSSFDIFAKRFNIDRHTLSIKFETVFDTVLFGKAKKKYSGYITYRDGVFLDKPLFVSKGFENKRSDNSRFTQLLQEEVLKMVCSKKSFEDVDSFVRIKVKKMLSGKISLDEIGIPKNITHKIPLGKISRKSAKAGEYRVCSAHIRGIQYSNQYFHTDFGMGTKPMLVYTVKRSIAGYSKTDVICFEHGSDVPAVFLEILDTKKMAEVLIHKKMERIYAARGWSYKLRQMSQNTLEKWV
ncbi:MAG: DNA polymerase domain-containing protein, partial [Candidatus Omnitrophota bacterium]